MGSNIQLQTLRQVCRYCRSNNRDPNGQRHDRDHPPTKIDRPAGESQQPSEVSDGRYESHRHHPRDASAVEGLVVPAEVPKCRKSTMDGTTQPCRLSFCRSVQAKKGPKMGTERHVFGS